jgi:hypothetical protein
MSPGSKAPGSDGPSSKAPCSDGLSSKAPMVSYAPGSNAPHSNTVIPASLVTRTRLGLSAGRRRRQHSLALVAPPVVAVRQWS